jgi:hypothetical protein
MSVSQTIYNSCHRVYGTCTDGSFEMCLVMNGYYMAAKEEEKLDDKYECNGNIQAVSNIHEVQ